MYSVHRRTTVALMLTAAAVMAREGFAITVVIGERTRDEIELDYSPGA